MNKLIDLSKEYLTLEETALYLSVSKAHLYGMVRRREIRHSKPAGKIIYISKEDILRYCAQNTVPENHTV